MTELPDIDIHYFEEEIKFNDVLCIVTHPTIGTISSIVGNYLVDHLNLRLIGAFLSPELSPTAVIREGLPQPPVRIYAGEYKDDPETDFDQLVVIASDLPMDRKVMFTLSDRIIDWAEYNNARAILTIEAINREKLSLSDDVSVYSVTSGETAGSYLDGLDVTKFVKGMVSGMSGVLLFKGRVSKFPVISLLADAHQNFPDARSAAAVLSFLNKLLPEIEIDYEPLLEQAEQVETQIREALSQISQPQYSEKKSSPQGMYA